MPFLKVVALESMDSEYFADELRELKFSSPKLSEYVDRGFSGADFSECADSSESENAEKNYD